MWSPRALAGLALPIAAIGLACTVNPATGNRQLNLYSEEQEVALGRQSHEQVAQQIGLYDDPELQAYVQQLGRELAARSERPHLPWTFGVVEDASVNAFALPGGFIYVTRGMLGHLTSEAELVGVLGHETGHVTARHSVNQMSKQQLTQLGLAVGMILSPEARQYGDLANLAGGLLFLKFSRDDERQADVLGVRYMQAAGYPPQAMAEVFALLGRVSATEQAGRLPNWLATHPNPEEREQRIRAQLAAGDSDPAAWRSDRFLAQVDGIVYGADPRQGFFRDGVFYHPELAFTMRSPAGWRGVNQRQAVVWQAPREDALLALTLAQGDDPDDAAREFFGQQGIAAVARWAAPSGSAGAQFQAQTQQGLLAGAVSFFEHGGLLYQLIGYAPQGRWDAYRDEVARAMGSFRRLTDQRLLAAEPMRLDVVTLDRAMTLREFARRYPSSVGLDELALINHVEADETLPAGRRVKRVVGGVEGASNTTGG